MRHCFPQFGEVITVKNLFNKLYLPNLRFLDNWEVATHLKKLFI